MPSLRAERHAFILDEIERRRFVSIADLGRRLEVTRETIRSDLSALARQRLLRQLRGGAAAIDKSEAGVAERERINAPGKAVIGDLVASVVGDGASLIIDSGSTTRAAARALRGRSGLTVYTNDLAVALALVDTAREVHVLGGRLGRAEHSTHGLDALEMLSNYRTDYALIGVGGLDARRGFTDYDRQAARERDAMIEAAAIPLLLVGHEKHGRSASVPLKRVALARTVVTDRAPPEDVAAYLADHGLDLLLP